MRLRLSMRGKLLITFGVIIALMLLGTGVVFWLMNNWKAAHWQAIDQEKLATSMAEREIDHLAWDVDLLTALLLGEPFTGQLDPLPATWASGFILSLLRKSSRAAPEHAEKIASLETPTNSCTMEQERFSGSGTAMFRGRSAC